MNSKEMRKRSRDAQIKKYGGLEGYMKEMKRRASLGGKKTWKDRKKIFHQI